MEWYIPRLLHSHEIWLFNKCLKLKRSFNWMIRTVKIHYSHSVVELCSTGMCSVYVALQLVSLWIRWSLHVGYLNSSSTKSNTISFCYVHLNYVHMYMFISQQGKQAIIHNNMFEYNPQFMLWFFAVGCSTNLLVLRSAVHKRALCFRICHGGDRSSNQVSKHWLCRHTCTHVQCTVDRVIFVLQQFRVKIFPEVKFCGSMWPWELNTKVRANGGFTQHFSSCAVLFPPLPQACLAVSVRTVVL